MIELADELVTTLKVYLTTAENGPEWQAQELRASLVQLIRELQQHGIGR